jgi:hypothetical protein
MIVRFGCSTFGMSCVGCKIYLIAPISSTYRSEKLVSSEWYCECCDLTFSTINRLPIEAKLGSRSGNVTAHTAAA